MDCCDHQNSSGHDHSPHQGEHKANHAMSHGSANSYLRRFLIVSVLLVPLALTNEFVTTLIGLPGLTLNHWIQFAIATIIFAFSLVFFQHAGHELRAKQYGMMTLVSMAVGAGYLFSAVSTFLPALETEFYLEISTLIWVLLFGHYLEAKSSAAASNALQEVAKLLPQTAHLIVDGGMQDVDVSSLEEGNVVLIKSGEKAPADGTVIEGESNVDESLITGESKPVMRRKNDLVTAGSIALDGSLKVRLSRVGKDSTIGQIEALIAKAQQTKPRSQQIADRAAAVLTFVAALTALLTALIWSLVVGEPLVFSITLAITVLVIACPHALGLAIPTVTTIATSMAVENGVFIKDLSKLEVIKDVDYIVLDKTGTLTEGKFKVDKIAPTAGIEKEDVLRIAASLGSQSSHVIDIPIVEKAKEAGLVLDGVEGQKSIGGKGITAKIDGKQYFLGSKTFIEEQLSIPSDIETQINALAKSDTTVVLLASDETLLGIITLSDQIRSESALAIDSLHSLGIKVAMLTGDNKQVAETVAKYLKIDTYFAEILPADKYKYVKELQDKGHIVLMVGDGINDAPALTGANAGIAIGAGTDVAVEAGDVVLTKNNPLDIVRLIKLARGTYAKMRQNLVWALGYNVIAIPAAAGVFAQWGFFLRPEIGALAMSLSTVIVVLNALTLKRIDLKISS